MERDQDAGVTAATNPPRRQSGAAKPREGEDAASVDGGNKEL